MVEFSGGEIQLGYLLVFGCSAILCFVSVRRLRYIEHDATRRGLFWLLVTSGGWSLAHVGYLATSSPRLQYALYVSGLILGFATVGPWLYFCSAYTGRSLHANRTVQGIAVGVFLTVAAVKVTNPLHDRYFTTELTATPFVYLQIHHQPLHWIVMALAYALAFVGIFMLFELFVRVSSDSRPLAVLVALTGVPVIFDALGVVSMPLLDITHSPLGVAAFAVGVCFVYLERFQLVRATGESDNPVVILDDDDRLREANRRARGLFPALEGGVGEPFAELLPGVAATMESPDPLLDIEVNGRTRYYDISSNPFSTDRTRLGRTILFRDITHREQYRQRLERQNDQLEQFASIVSHDLRNPLTVAKGRTELALEEDDTDHLDGVVEAHDRMEGLIDDILTLARKGTAIDETKRVDLAVIATQSWEMIATEAATLVLATDSGPILEADPERLQQLFENLFRNALEHGGHDVTVTVGELADADGFYVEDDGQGIPAESQAGVFQAGYTTSPDGTGFGLAIVEEIVAGHDWEIQVTDGRDGGARFEITTGDD
ncbi:histidine kinase [Salinadaptatus halalkaliphilus]|uniref:histidine kinase n=1 Tax=Salinadaptatus halalkaliphilus TaxID=2419781 RepID=A0A4S3TQ83_9EURY|nr:ATP-binding protein [Salinadaptatus halalkaliphilus]THE65375.1 histidine kinase [Salinadaptatus halalkaliphilus]